MEKDLIASDGTLFQVLDLPASPPALTRQEVSQRQHEVRRIIRQAFQGEANGR